MVWVVSIVRELIQELFDGPVPLLTRRALYLLLYVMALFCSLGSLYPISPLFGLFELIGLSFLVAAIGFAIQYLFFRFQYSSFAHLEQENISDGVFDNATDEMAPNPYCRIRILPGKEPFAISISNIVFRVILISSPLAEMLSTLKPECKHFLVLSSSSGCGCFTPYGSFPTFHILHVGLCISGPS